MVKCTRCGADGTEGKKFCSGCGAKLPAPGSAAASREPSPPPPAAERVRRSGSSSPHPVHDRPVGPSNGGGGGGAPDTLPAIQNAPPQPQRERAGPPPSAVAQLVESAQTRNSRRREALVSSSNKTDNRISVAVRKRPLGSSEAPLDILSVSSLNAITLLEPKKALDGTPNVEAHKFLFDEVFDESDDNYEVYGRTAAKLVDYVYDGGFCSCFAYGQTGSGKTFTMMGTGSAAEGLYVQAAKDIFARLEKNLEVAVSFFEIYAAKLYDLLNNKEQVYAREDENQRVHIRGLSEHGVTNVPTLMSLVRKGLELRSSNSTCMNDESSRSHAVMEIKLKLCTGKLIGKLTVTDLAGSERGSVGAAGDKQVQMEGAEINKSLLALKECIRALDQGKRHIPFRQSELTQVLKESFTGEYGHTVMIANLSPSLDSCAETLNTLRYAYRVKELTSDDGAGGAPQGGAAGAGGGKAGGGSNGPAAGGRRRSSNTAGVGAKSTSRNVIRNAQGEVITETKEKPRCPGCGEERRNLALLEAHKESCPLVTMSCEHCPSSFKRQDLEKHSKTCSKFPVDCKLCKEKIAREQLKKHQSVDCPKGETSCLFCRMKLLREDLESHKSTCEQRTVTCEECEAKVKFSLMAAHKRTCKGTKRSAAGGGGGGGSSDNAANAATNALAQIPPPSGGGAVQNTPPAPTPIDTAAPPAEPAEGRRRRSLQHGGDTPTATTPVSASAPAPPARPGNSSLSASPRDENGGGAGGGSSNPTVQPSPPLTQLKKKQSANLAGVKARAAANGGGGGAPTCDFRDVGCDGASGCSPTAHNQLLLRLVLTQQQENTELRKEVGSLHLRVQKLEHYNQKLRELNSLAGGGAVTGGSGHGSNPSKFAHLNGLPEHVKNADAGVGNTI